MSINVNEDVIGSGGFYGGHGGHGAGLYLIAILLIFFVVVAGIWGGNRHHDGGGHGGHRDGDCAGMMTINRYGNFMDPQLAKIETEIACRTGAIEKQNAVDTGAIVHILDNQTCQIKEGIAGVINNQNQLAHEQVVMALNQRIQSLQDDKLALGGKLLQQETVNVINAGNCAIGHRLDQIECRVPDRPPFYAAGGSPFINPFNFQPAPVMVRNDRNDRDCCCG